MDYKNVLSNWLTFDFLIFLFPVLLKKAMRQGVFRENQSRHYDDANIKGRVDVARFIRKDIPFAGHVAYQTREYSADNDMNQLIRHTIEYIKTKKVKGKCPYGNLLSGDDEVKRAVSLVCAHTFCPRTKCLHGVVWYKNSAYSATNLCSKGLVAE